MTSVKPYLIRAYHQFFIDNNATPYIVVRANVKDCVVPRSMVKDGTIVLNISYNAVKFLSMDKAFISFEGRFSGVTMQCFVPYEAIHAIYPREDPERGLVFSEEEMPTEEEHTPTPPSPIVERQRPQLTVVKND